MWRSSDEVCNDKDCGQHQDDAGATRCNPTENENCDEASVGDESERERNDKNGAVILTRKRDRLKNEGDNQQWHSDSQQPTDALRSMHDV
jgi:hypothetical protein